MIVASCVLLQLGYVGRDVEEIIKDLVEVGILLVKSRLKERMLQHNSDKAEAIILKALVGANADSDTLKTFQEKYRRVGGAASLNRRCDTGCSAIHACVYDSEL